MPQIQFGNPAPVHSPNGDREPLPGPAVTYLSIPDGEDTHGVSLYGVVDGHDVAGFDADGAHETTLPRHPAELTLQIAQNGHLLTRAAGHEAFLSAVATWTAHSSAAPSWVWSDNAELERQLSEWYGCPTGVPADVEATHHTDAGPPGIGVAAPEVSA